MRTDTPIRLIALDLDGTIFRNDKSISPKTAEALGKAVDRGVEVVPVTGRPLKGVPPEVMALPGVRYIITSNGAKIYRLPDETVLYEDLMEKEQALKVLEILRGRPVVPDCFIDGFGNMPVTAREIVPKIGVTQKIVEYLLSPSRILHEDLEEFVRSCPRNVEKVTVNFYLKGEESKCRTAVVEELRQLPGLTVVTGASHNCEINRDTVAKGTALLYLADLLGIPREATMACGDECNDIDMLRKAGVGVAMGNASDAVKSHADFITRTNEEDGVAHAVETFIL